MSLSLIKRSSKNHLDYLRNDYKPKNAIERIPKEFSFDDPLFNPYQIKWLLDKSPVSVVAKSRQIGWSYTYAFRAAYKAAINRRSTIVTSYNRESVKNFILDCAKWSKLLGSIFELIIDEEIINKNDIGVFEIKFLNGRKIIGLPSNAVSFRSYSGYDVVIDEAAYREESLESLLASSMATLIHGGTVRIASTYAGINNDFYELVQKVKKGVLPYSFYQTNFREAISDGLYKRLCVKNKEVWTLEKENIWIESIYAMYGIRAREELDTIASDFSGEGKIFNRKDFKKINVDVYSENQWEYIFLRSFDIAASTVETSFYTASVKVAFHTETEKIIILGYTAEQLAPIDGDNYILQLSELDGENTIFLLEQEPGSSGIKWIEQMKQSFYEKNLYNIYGYQPRINKIQRYIPASNAIAKGEILILDEPWANDMIEILHRVSIKKTPLVSDVADCLGNVYDYLKNEMNLMLGS